MESASGPDIEPQLTELGQSHPYRRIATLERILDVDRDWILHGSAVPGQSLISTRTTDRRCSAKRNRTNGV